MVSSSKIRLLIISDNFELCEYVNSLLTGPDRIYPVDVFFGFSPSNANSSYFNQFEASVYDLRDVETVLQIIKNFDLVLSLHCKQIFPSTLIENVKCINVHPGFNPYNRGWFPQVFSIINGLPAGATIHIMQEEIDHGAIIAQCEVVIQPSDTSHDVYRRVLESEKKLLKAHLVDILQGTYEAVAPAGIGNYNQISDFRKFCELDLGHIGTLDEHLRLLRALTHADHKNAFFEDDEGNRYFVRVCIERAQ